MRTPDLEGLRARLAALQGRALWRCLDEAADTPAFRDLLAHEFPALAAFGGGVGGRRRFLGALSASMALGGLSACGKPEDADNRGKEVPYVRQPANSVPSATLVYASAWLLDGIANGADVSTRNGRPIKVEGNPRHRWTRGGTDVFGQASVLGLYDPDRSQAVRYLDRISDWPSFTAAMTGQMGQFRARGGEGLRLLTGPVTSPTLLGQIAAMQKAFPAMRWHVHAPSGILASYAGTEAAFGRRLQTRWRFDRAKTVVALDGDFLDHGPQQAGVAAEWAAARRASAGGPLLTLFSASATPGLTSAKADHPVVVPTAAMEAVAAGLAQVVAGGEPADGPDRDWVARAGAALRGSPGESIVVAGGRQTASLQAAVHRLNAQLGGPVFYTDAVVADAEPAGTLLADMQAGHVDALVMLDVNPAYSLPGFDAALTRVKLKIHAGLHDDETAIRADWHVPLSHPLESWGDARAFDGTVTFLQPTVVPFYGTRTASEILSLLLDPVPSDGLSLLRRTHAAGDPTWRGWLLDGFKPGTALPPVAVTPTMAGGMPAAKSGLTVLVRPDASVWDGSWANNGWLQELPRPLTKVTWDNPVAIGPGLAQRLKIAIGDHVAVEAGGKRIVGPVWITPGQADDTVVVTLGYGRRTGGSVADGVGMDVTALLPGDGVFAIEGASLSRVAGRTEFATTEQHGLIEGNGLLRVQAVGAAPAGDGLVHRPIFYANSPSDGRAWGMVIDTDSCIGCNACVVACQAENNIPVVGAEEVSAGREMHWLRVDRYYEGGVEDPKTHFMPVPCMHCEDAPCEVGCPVEATLHDHEGLNLMVYNRCVGTRACSGYCPYKVRHFNYLDYTSGVAPSIAAQRNPDVTVRARGVMEKCTYCVQRIAAARIDSDKSGMPIPDGAVRTACQQGCPTSAITFGDLADAGSKVRALREDPRNYALLGELNTRPRTTYLAALSPGDVKAG